MFSLMNCLSASGIIIGTQSELGSDSRRLSSYASIACSLESYFQYSVMRRPNWIDAAWFMFMENFLEMVWHLLPEICNRALVYPGVCSAVLRLASACLRSSLLGLPVLPRACMIPSKYYGLKFKGFYSLPALGSPLESK